MSQNAINQLTADAKLTARLAAATSQEELQQILHDSLEDAHIAARDPYTGKFVRTEPEAATAVPAAAATAPKEFRKKETIAGTSLEFVAGSEAELTRQILDANRIAATFAESHRRERTLRTVQQEAMDRSDAELALRRGEISTAEYLERTNAIENYLSSQGIDTKKIAGEQLTQSWLEASTVFKRTTGADWPGGTRNQELIGLEIAAMSLTDADDKVAALTQAYERLKSKGMLFDGDHDAAEMEKLALSSNATPAEIVQAWKQAQGDLQNPEAANQEFLKSFANGRRSSGLFNA